MHIKRFNLIILTAFFLSSESVLGLLGNLVGRYRPTTIESKTFPLILQFGEKYDESSIGLQSVEGVFASRNEFEYIKSLAVTADAEARESLRMMAEDSFITTLEEDPLRDTQTYKQETLNIPFPKFEARRLKEYNLNLVQANEAHKFTKGKNAKVCLIDSGVDLQHLDLNEDLFSGLNLNTEMRWDIDLISHGTYLAGIISAKHNNAIEIEGIAPEAEIFVIRIFENTSREFEFASGLVKAVERCAIAGARIINLSLGGYKKSELEQQGFSELVNRYDLLIVAAGGNKGFSAPPLYPASYSDIVSVGAVNEYKERWFFSQADVDIVAPGTDVLGLKGGTQDGFKRSSGTSIACAHVTAVAALLWSWKPCATLLEIKTALFMSAESLGNDREFGYGLVQAMDALIYLNGGLLLIANSSPNGICSPADTNASKPTKYPTLAPSFEATGGEEEDWACDRSTNFILDVSYNQISLTDDCKSNNVCDANPIYAEDGKTNDIEEAVTYCKNYCYEHFGCPGFFFQKHMNGHEICGFFMNEVDIGSGTPVWHGHQEGSRVCTLELPFEVCSNNISTYTPYESDSLKESVITDFNKALGKESTTHDPYVAWCILRGCPQFNIGATAWCSSPGGAACRNECNGECTNYGVPDCFQQPSGNIKQTDIDKDKNPTIGNILPDVKWLMTYGKGEFEQFDQDPALWKPDSKYTKQSGTWDDPTFYVRRLCLDCAESHQDIIYKRITRVPSDMDIANIFLENWFDKDNTLGVDFKLYSSFEDAQNDTNEWKFCNYNDPGIGFPRDCGPVSAIVFQWNSLIKGGKNDISYYVI